MVYLPKDAEDMVPKVDIYFEQLTMPSGNPKSGKAWYTMPDCDIVREFTGIDRWEAWSLARMDLYRRYVGLDWAQRLEGVGIE